MCIYLSKNRVVHQLEEIFLKGVFSHLSLSGVEVNVLLQPLSLVEFNHSVDLFSTLHQVVGRVAKFCSE